jgi:hypothetical protein
MTKIAPVVLAALILLFACNAQANDPVPYPNVGGGGGNQKVKIKGDVKGSTTSTDSQTSKSTTNIKGGKTTTTTSSSNVMVEGKPVSITGNPGMGNGGG